MFVCCLLRTGYNDFFQGPPRKWPPCVLPRLRGAGPALQRPVCIYAPDTLPEARRTIPDTSVRARPAAGYPEGNLP